MLDQTFVQLKKMLGQLDSWLDATTRYAKERGFDPNVLVGSRLAPDQFPFARQVQSACDTPKLAIVRLTDKQAPSFPDNEQTIDELRARIRATLGFLETVTAQDLQGAADRVVSQPRWEGKVMRGQDYWIEHVIPNFFFHVTHAYAILRHNGVNLGKRDFLGTLSLKNP
jgi:hypothetical protein